MLISCGIERNFAQFAINLKLDREFWMHYVNDYVLSVSSVVKIHNIMPSSIITPPHAAGNRTQRDPNNRHFKEIYIHLLM